MRLEGLKGVSAWLVYNKIVFSLVFLRRFNVIHNDQLTFIELLKTCENLADYKDVAAKLNSDKFKKLSFSQAETITFFKSANDTDKTNMLLEALTITELDDDDCLRLLSLHEDSNGVPYSRNNIKSMQSGDIVPLMLKTLLACASLDCDFSLMTEDDLNLFKKGRVNINDEASEILVNNSTIETGNLLSLAVKRLIARFR